MDSNSQLLYFDFCYVLLEEPLEEIINLIVVIKDIAIIINDLKEKMEILEENLKDIIIKNKMKKKKKKMHTKKLNYF